MTPKFIEEIITRENLQVDRIVRNGPRYWVGLVSHGETHLILKAILKDETWKSPGTENKFSTAAQLRAEISALIGIGRHESKLAGRIPHLIDSSVGQDVWTLREQVKGTDMSGSDGSLIFRPEFFEQIPPEQLVDYIMSYQSLTDELKDSAMITPQTDQTNLHSKMIIADLDYPQGYLEPLSNRVNEYLKARISWHDDQPKVIAHGEVYPPHIFLSAGKITLIDWENFSLNNPMSDFMQVWVRAFDNPAWRDEFKHKIWEKSPLEPEALEQLWDIEKLYQSARNLNYLHYSLIETSREIADAAASFVENIEEVLGRNAYVGI